MGESGDPRKQQRPDERLARDQSADAAALLTERFPPRVGGVVTAFGAAAVGFPGFRGGKAIRIDIICGPLNGEFVLDPEAASTVCEQIQAAALLARTGLTPATPDQVDDVAQRAADAGLVLK